jgi:hypothetical protein
MPKNIKMFKKLPEHLKKMRDKFPKKKDRFKKYVPYIAKYSWILFIVIMILFFRKAILLAAFVLIAAFPQLYKRLIPYPLGIELITFFTVLISFWISPLVAWLLSFPMMVLGMIFDGRYIHKWSILKYTVVCLLAYILIIINMPITAAGITITIIVNIMFAVIWTFTSGGAVLIFLPGLIINIILNFILFGRLGDLMLNALNL